MEKINFLFAVHCHQPVGNFEHVIEDAYRQSYAPFIDALEKFPSIKMTVHYTGILLSWFKEKHPEFLEKLRNLAQRNQIEIMTGGYYEPILAVLPDSDKIGQIVKQTVFTRNHLDYDPKGMWLAERIWEPHLAKSLFEAGVEYTVLDDYHFISAGLEAKDLNGYFVTEEQGCSVKIFPINKQLRYLIPFKLPHETIDYLRQLATEAGDNATILADDGEKFGVWPGTHKWVFEEKWLENFFAALQAESGWIRTMTYSEYLGAYPSRGRIYLPTASYFEMMEWSLLVKAGTKFGDIEKELKANGKLEQYQQFFKGGFWRNFFVKYPESNSMHKKMLLVSKKVETAKKNFSPALDDISDELWQGQCNCPYWHGVFGGLYLNYLRHAIYEHLIKAENMADKINHKADKWLDVEVRDFDADASDEVLVSTSLLNLYFDPDCGGAVSELDYRPKAFNLINTLSRKEEVYHKDIKRLEAHQFTLSGAVEGAASIHDAVRVKEAGLQKFLNYDWYRRLCFIEHFLGDDTTIEDFSSCRYSELGDFVNQPYSHKEIFKKDEVAVILSRDGSIYSNGRSHPIRVTKTFTVVADSSEIDIKWEIENIGGGPVDFWAGIEYNFGFLAGNDPDRYYVINGQKPDEPHLASTGESKQVYEVNIIDKWSGISIIIDASRRTDIWRFPIETVSQSEGGFERIYQNSAILSHWRAGLPKGGKDVYSVKFKIQEGAP